MTWKYPLLALLIIVIAHIIDDEDFRVADRFLEPTTYKRTAILNQGIDHALAHT